MTTRHELIKRIEEIGNNPSFMQRTILNLAQESIEGHDGFVDPTNPFIFLMEALVCSTSAFMSQSQSLTRRQYPSLAQTQEDLYHHMADVDYLGRFASPSRTNFSVLIGKEEAYRKAVSTGVGGVRKLVIPKHTEFTIAGYTFTMQYPIEIRIMGHGGLQVMYDSTEVSPLQRLETNIVEWSIQTLDGVDFIMVTIPVNQFAIESHYGQLNVSTGFNETYSYADHFYYARAYIETPEGQWKEIRTTHTDQVYDPKTMTAVLKVSENGLGVRVPEIYFSENMAQGNLRVDVYTTRGELDLILGDYNVSEFGARWRDLDRSESSQYSAPLNSFSAMAVFSDNVVRGGSKPLSFEELRERVMSNSIGSMQLPITGSQLIAAGNDYGYDIVKSVDNVTRRVYKATRNLAAPSDGSSVVPAACRVTTIQQTMTALSAMDGVYDNGARITLSPELLYERKDGLTRILDDSERDFIESQPPEIKTELVNARRLLYTPFYYVLDSTRDAFAIRPYELDRPKVVSQRFVQENNTAQLEIGIGNYSIERTDNGYLLWITTRSGQAFKDLLDEQVHVQMSFIPQREASRAYLNGEFYGVNDDDERVYRFRIDTTFDVDASDHLLLKSFLMFVNEPRNSASALEQTFDFIWLVSDYSVPGLEHSEIIEKVGRFILPEGDYADVTHEQLTIKLGSSLNKLWNRSRTVAGDINYERHEIDELLYYESNIYERDPITGRILLNYNADTGEVEYSLKHAAGDPVLDSDGEQRYKHRVGDVKVDGEGNPIVKSGRELMRQFDILAIDAVWRFADDSSSVAYRNEIVTTITDWVVTDLEELSKRTLERTELYFFPKTSFGEIGVFVESGSERTIDAEQAFRVKYYMTNDRFAQGELREPLTRIAIEAISQCLRSTTVSQADISSRIKAAAGDDVLSVESEGLAGETGYQTITVRDSDASLSLGKRLRHRSNGSIVVEDNVTVEFIRHTV